MAGRARDCQGRRSTAGSRLRRTFPTLSLVWRLNAGLITFESNPGAIAKIYHRPSACGFPNNVIGWMGLPKASRAHHTPIANATTLQATIGCPPCGGLSQ